MVGLFPDAAAAGAGRRAGARPPPPGRRRLLLVLRRAAAARPPTATPAGLGDGRPGLATPLDLNETVDLIHSGRRAGRRGPRRPQVVQRLLPAGLLPRGRRLRRRGGLHVRCRRLAAPGGVRGFGPARHRLFRQPLSGGDRRGAAPSCGWRSPPSPSCALAFAGEDGRSATEPRAGGGRSAMHDLSLYLLEVLENSIRAGATHVDVGFVIDQASDELRLTVDDDGTRPDRHARADARPLLHHQAGQEDRAGPEPAQGRRPGGRRRPRHRAVARPGRACGWRRSCA